jgi:hypothetical protein
MSGVLPAVSWGCPTKCLPPPSNTSTLKIPWWNGWRRSACLHQKTTPPVKLKNSPLPCGTGRSGCNRGDHVPRQPKHGSANNWNGITLSNGHRVRVRSTPDQRYYQVLPTRRRRQHGRKHKQPARCYGFENTKNGTNPGHAWRGTKQCYGFTPIYSKVTITIYRLWVIVNTHQPITLPATNPGGAWRGGHFWQNPNP